MGKSGGGTNTVTSNAAPPPDVMAQYDQLIAQANTAAATPLSQYPAGTNASNIVAPFNSTQQQAFNEVQGAQGASQPLYNQAQGLIQNASQQIVPQTVDSADIQQYQNPYTQQVINSTMANINQQDAGQQSQLAGSAASSGAFGGDRQAVSQALLANQQDLANNQTISGLESQGYSQAVGEANTQQQAALSAQEASQYLGQQGGAGLTNLGNTEQNAALTGASALTSVGGLQQQLAQEQLNVPYEQFQAQQAYPYQNLSWLSGISTGLGSGEGGSSSTTSPAASLTSQLGGLGLTGLGIAGATGAFSPSTPGSSRGGRIEGLIKRLNNGGAVMMPTHYDRGGLIKHYDNGGIIPGQMTVQEMENSTVPDLSQNSRFSLPNMTKGVGVPSMMKSQGQNSTTTGGGSNGIGGSAGEDIAAAKGAKGLYNYLNPSSQSIAPVESGTSMDADAQLGYTGDMPTSIGGESIGQTLPWASVGGEGGGGGAGVMDAASDLPWLADAGISDAGATAGATAVASDAAPAAMTAATDAGIFDTVGSSIMDALPFLAALFKRGGSVGSKGLIKHYDDGGLVPSDTSTNPMQNNMTAQYANMSTQQLQQLLPRIQQPQMKQIVQRVLQQKQVMPNTGNIANVAPSAPAAPQATRARGGLIKHYDDGGSTDDDYLTQLTSNNTSAPNSSTAPDNLPSLGLMKADPSIALPPPVNLTRGDDTPSAGLVKPTDNSGDFKPIPIPTFHDDHPINKVDPWLSVAAAGARMMGSNSPHILQALGEGANEGLTNYGQQKKEAAEETYKAGSIQDARDQMVREAQQYNATGQQNAKKLNADIQNQLTTQKQKQQELDAELPLKAAQANYYNSGAGTGNKAVSVIDPDTNQPVLMPARDAIARGLAPTAGYNQLAVTLSPEAIKQQSDSIFTTGKVPTGLGLGMNGNKKAILNQLAADHPDANLGDIQAQFAGETSAAKTVGSTSGRIEFASESLGSMLPLVKQASASIDRTQYPTLNAIQNAVNKGTGDTKIIALNTYLNAAMADQAQLIARSGVSSDAARKTAHDAANAAFTDGQVDTYIDSINKEVSAQRAAGRGAMANVVNLSKPQTSAPTAATSPQIPAGGKLMGTSGGKSVYEVPDGKGGLTHVMEQ